MERELYRGDGVHVGELVLQGFHCQWHTFPGEDVGAIAAVGSSLLLAEEGVQRVRCYHSRSISSGERRKRSIVGQGSEEVRRVGVPEKTVN